MSENCDDLGSVYCLYVYIELFQVDQPTGRLISSLLLLSHDFDVLGNMSIAKN
jgi:hypothetical protein